MAITRDAIRVHGLDEALAVLNNDIAKVPLRTLQGMIAGGLIIQKEAQKLVPVDTANLKASAATIWATKKTSSSPNFRGEDSNEMDNNHKAVVSAEKAALSSNIFNPEVEVLFSAAYAIYVHEDLKAIHKVGQAKFLQAAVANKSAEVIAAVKMEAGRA